MNELLQNERDNKSAVGEHAMSIINQKVHVPDDIVCALLQGRLNQSDCLIHGYLIDGFPLSIKQWTRFSQWNMMPSIVVCYRVDNSEIEYNIKNSKIDLSNGDLYDKDAIGFLPEEIQRRLKDPQPELSTRMRERIKTIDNVFAEIEKKLKNRC